MRLCSCSLSPSGALAVVELVVGRDAAEYRAPGAAAQSVVLLAALFLSEAGAPPRSIPVRGLAAAALLVSGVVMMDPGGFGVFQNASRGATPSRGHASSGRRGPCGGSW